MTTPAPNPNWPLIDEAISFQSGPTSNAYQPHWVSVIERSRGSWATARGRQYELDQVQTGTVTTRLQNKDGAFDPTNTASPYYPQVLPYRAYRRRAQYPATVNILVNDQANAGTTSGMPAGTNLPHNVVDAGIYIPSIVVGTPNVYSVTLPASPVSNTPILQVSGWTVCPGVPMTASVKVTASVATSMKLQFFWTDVTGATISAPSGSTVSVTTAQTITVTATPPANAAGGSFNWTLASSPGSISTITATNLQVERAAAATAFVTPGTWYPLFFGYVERFPLSWEANGQYGLSNLTVVDIFGWMSQRKILSPIYHEMLNLNPTWLYCLDEPAGAAAVQDAAGNVSAAVIRSGYGGALTQCATGTSMVAAAPYLPMGLGGPVLGFTNTAGNASSAYLDISARGTVGPPPTTSWTRVWGLHSSAAQYAAMLAAGSVVGVIWFAQDSRGNSIQLTVNSSGALHAVFYINGTLAYTQGLGTLTADSWHLLMLCYDFATGNVTTYIDNVITRLDFGPGLIAPTFGPGALEQYGAAAANGLTYLAANPFLGDMCLAAEYPVNFLPPQIALLYNTFRYGGQPDAAGNFTSATRYADVLRWTPGPYNGPSSIDNYSAGQTTTYGPPTDLFAARDSVGTSAVTALQNVVDTENGAHYVDAAGVIQFKARRARYNLPTPVVIFGEHTASSEIPYTGTINFGYDTTRVANDAAITQTSTSAVVRFQDATSQGVYGDIQLSRNVNTLNALELTDAAQFLVQKNKAPALRLETIHVNVGSQPNSAVWLAMLALELGTRVRVMRRAPAPAPAMQLDGFVEQINWTMVGPDAGVDLQISPYSNQQFWTLSSSHVTVKTAITSVGATSLVINPLPDSATNPVQAGISAAGDLYGWIIDAGTAKAEFITVVGVTAGSTGYTSATLTIGQCQRLDTGATGTGFRFTHSVGAVVQDLGGLTQQSGWPGAAASIPLLAITAAPGAYDALSTLGSTTIAGY